MNRVLVVDDEPGMREALRASFHQRGWLVDTADGPVEAIAKFRPAPHALVVSDIRMPGGDGLELMRDLRRLSPATAVILLTAFGSVPDAVTAMRDGACDYLVKPVSFEHLEAAAKRVLAQSSAKVRQELEFVGHSPVLLSALDRARQVAASDADILIEAESGTGKELLARLIHRSSPRRDQPLVAVNCAAFPETLLESELFGHVKGAFTGAMAAKPGKFELANHGTLLLDEVGEMPLSLQAKLLRVLQEREVDRLGGTRSVPLDIRVIATTNRPLLAMVRQGTFRSDLYYRLNVIPLSLPPLREHLEDIPELAEHFARTWVRGGRPIRLSPEFLSQLARHSWPGNVRELANFIRRAVALSRDGEIAEEALADLSPGSPPPSAENVRAGTSLRELERQLLESTLAATGGNRSRTAELLGVSLRTVRNKIRDYGLPPRGSYAHD
jgi:two-component system response regulator AtoC